MQHTHNSVNLDEQWVILSAADENPLASETNSNRAGCLPSYYGKIYQPGDPCWRVADTKKPFDIHKLIDDFCSWYERVVDSSGYHFTSRVASNLPRLFQGNPLMLGFLLWDLGRYSQVFLDGEGVDLEVCSEPFGSFDWYSICFSLTVSGRGIPQDRERMLFLPSGTGRKRSAGDHASTNLYYASIIAGLLGGVVSVRNDSDWGAEYMTEICLQKKLG